MIKKLLHYSILMRLNKPIGILLILWPTLWALWIAGDGSPQLSIVIIFSCGVVLMRSAGCVINDYADRNIDKHVERTKLRPLVTGIVSPKEALIVFAVLSSFAFSLVLSLNLLTIYLSFGAILLASIYPFMKRYTHLPQVVLGMAFGCSVPMAFAALTNDVPQIAWLIYVQTVVWTVVYDTMYAIVDRDDDIKIGVKSTAILFGDADKIIIAMFQLLLILGFMLLGRELQLGLYYFIGVAIAAMLSAYQQYLIKDRDRTKCFKAFLNNNWYGAAVFAGLLAHYLDKIYIN